MRNRSDCIAFFREFAGSETGSGWRDCRAGFQSRQIGAGRSVTSSRSRWQSCFASLSSSRCAAFSSPRLSRVKISMVMLMEVSGVLNSCDGCHKFRFHPIQIFKSGDILQQSNLTENPIAVVGDIGFGGQHKTERFPPSRWICNRNLGISPGAVATGVWAVITQPTQHR
ncbi:MAG: hypothetical protein R3C41_21085 [Calditrichia bacterium]